MLKTPRILRDLRCFYIMKIVQANLAFVLYLKIF
jgi:hypothetical protein